MLVVYMEHTSNHLGNNLAKEFFAGHTHQCLCVKERGQCLWPAAVCVMTFLPSVNKAQIIQSDTGIISNKEIFKSLLAGGLW